MSNQIVEKTQLQHVLTRPEMYAGDMGTVTDKNIVVYNGKTLELRPKLTYSLALLKFFEETITNATDNSVKHPDCNKINIEITDKYFKVYNNGPSIPIVQQRSEVDNIIRYVPETAFSRMNTSSNYDDTIVRTSTGVNGVGIKLVNAFSTKFIIRVVNSGQQYLQVFERNLSVINKPIITPSNEENCVEVTSYPDFKRINITSGMINEDNKLRLLRRAFDATLFNARVTINNVKLPKLTVKKYVQLFTTLYKIDASKLVFAENCGCKIAYATCPANKKAVFSYVNNIETPEGGYHVKNFTKQFKEYISQIGEQQKLKLSDDTPMKYSFVMLFQTVDKPTFSSQAKTKLTTELNYSWSSTILNIVQRTDILNLLQSNKKIKKGPKLNGNYSERLTKNADDANKHDGSCTLFVVEGNSAGSLVLSCMYKLPHCDAKYGVFQLIGKIQNVTKSSEEKYLDGPIIQELIKVFGLDPLGQEQIPRNKLRYGRIVCVKDADTDGSSIMGLVLNLFFEKFKYLLYEDFFYEFITPMTQVITNEKINSNVDQIDNSDFSNFVKHEYYNMAEYKQNVSNIRNIKTVKFLKGLASIDQSDGERYFENYDNHLIQIKLDPQSDQYMYIAYGKNTDIRKRLIELCDDNTFLPRTPGIPIDISHFIRYDLINFSWDACLRAIPSLYDGLKPSQRKVLYTLFNEPETKAKQMIKVSALTGKVMDFSEYHHGDASMTGTINGMQQSWPGSNNIPLLGHSGIIGSRSALGKDGGQPRYVYANLSDVSRLIFPKDDDPLLERMKEDEILVEPKYYVPIIPMILINGCNGIAVGYKSSVPLHSYYDCIDYIKEFLTKSESTSVNYKSVTRNEINEHVKKIIHSGMKTLIHTYYPYYKGKIEAVKNGYMSYDVHEFVNPRDYKERFFEKHLIPGRSGNSPFDYNPCYLKVSEIPIDTNKKGEMDKIRMYLDNKYNPSEKKQKSVTKKIPKGWEYLIDFIDHSVQDSDKCSGKTEIYFKLKNDDGSVPIDIEITKSKKLLSTNSMVLFDKDIKIVMYKTIEDILIEFITERYNLYILRKRKLVNIKHQELIYIANKCNFINAIIENKLEINKMKYQDVINYLIKNEYVKKNDSYDYLTDIQIRYQTKEYHQKLIDLFNLKKDELLKLKKTPIEQIWMSELDVLLNYLLKQDEKKKKVFTVM